MIPKALLGALDASSMKRKAELGQFMTPPAIARFMASLFPPDASAVCRLLDPGAGIGNLVSAFLDRWADGRFGFEQVQTTAYEIDGLLFTRLENRLMEYAGRLSLKPQIVIGDFIEEAVNRFQFDRPHGFTHAILNPPYKKINSLSSHRLLLRAVGIETVNLYSAFVALTLALMEQGGQIVAIIPRSFCNGLYYRSFREFILEHAAIRHMHLFAARNKAFKDDAVLQENVIIRLERGGTQGAVNISTSTDATFADYSENAHPFERIVFPLDREKFIHIPTTDVGDALESFPAIRYTLADLGIKVSTGPVVDFRVREHIRDIPEPGCVPLLYSGHFTGQVIEWPNLRSKKPNAIQHNHETEKWLYPTGFYAVVRRFSSKEEKRRIVASVVEPHAFPNALKLAFENHLNVFHADKHGLPEALARGLTVYLNTTAVDAFFRRFNGHTQVNATDLKLIKYPNRDTLTSLGDWAKTCGELTQAMVDEQLKTLKA